MSYFVNNPQSDINGITVYTPYSEGKLINVVYYVFSILLKAFSIGNLGLFTTLVGICLQLRPSSPCFLLFAVVIGLLRLNDIFFFSHHYVYRRFRWLLKPNLLFSLLSFVPVLIRGDGFFVPLIPPRILIRIRLYVLRRRNYQTYCSI